MKIRVTALCLLVLFSLFFGACARRQPRPAADVEYVCVAEVGGSIFHRTPCIYVQKIEDDRKLHFSTFEEAKATGLEPCEECILEKLKKEEREKSE